jgi:hypothetical protein
MSHPMPGPYPVYPQQYQGTPVKPPRPQTVLYAFYSMIAGAAFAVVNLFTGLGEKNTIRHAIEVNEAQNPQLSGQDVNTIVQAAVVFIVIGALIAVGLWLWMAFKCRAGRHWARVTGTVFFGISALSTLGGFAASSASGGSNPTFASSDTAAGKVVGVLEVLVGLAAVILLWHKQSGPYFKPQQSPYGYPQPGFYPGYPQQPQAPFSGQPGYQGYDPASFQGQGGFAGPGDQAAGTGEQPPANPWGTPPQ